MNRSRTLAGAAILLAGLAARAGTAEGPSFDAQLLAIQQAWAEVNYDTPAGNPRVQAFAALEKRVEEFVKQHPGRAEALIWEGIIESSYAGAKGGLGALGLAKEARASLEAALEIDPNALDGSAFTSLGALYFKVPGFPVGFGDDEKARRMLEKALALNPEGIDQNYFYAEFLVEQREYVKALRYLEKAAKAPDRPGRERADVGRRTEIAALTAKVREKKG